MSVTYNPILETTDLNRVRVLTPLHSPRMGTALVIEPATGEPILVRAGEKVPDRRTGNYRRAHVVDLARYGLVLTTELPSQDPSFGFGASVSFACEVVDPVAIAVNGTRDMTLALRPPLVKVMRAVAQDFDILDLGDAERALNAALDRMRWDGTVSLGGFLVELDNGDTSEIHRVRRETRLGAMRRDDMQGVVKGGRDAIAAQWLAVYGGDPTELIKHEAAAKFMENDQLLDAMRILSASEEKTEPYANRKERDRILREFLGSAGVSPAKRISRRSRLAGSLRPAAEAKPEDGGAAAEPADAPRSRVRGSWTSPLRPSSDGSVPAEDSPDTPGVELAGEAKDERRTTSRVRGRLRTSDPDERDA